MINRDQKPNAHPFKIQEHHRLSRRALLRGAASATGAALLAQSELSVAGALPPTSPLHATNAIGDVVVSPRPGTRTASPHTQISFRNVTLDQLGDVRVTGSHSGGHTGLLLPHSDGQGVSFVPDAPFWAVESVTVWTGLKAGSGNDGAMTFTTAQPGKQEAAPSKPEASKATHPPRAFRSRPDLLPPAMSITKPIGPAERGYIFLGAKVPGGQNGAMILDEQGELVWFHPLTPSLTSLDDMRVQDYQGQPVLTWWEGTGPIGHGQGHYVMRDTSYRQIATIGVGNGYAGGDLHEFQITPQGTAIVSIYNPTRWDLRAAGGPNIGTATDGIVQEIDIPTGLVLFEWHSLDHIGVEESYGAAPNNPAEPFDYLHLNSIDPLDDGSLLISGRHTSGIYKIDRRTGDVVWRLNGKRSDFAMGSGTKVAYQHDARMHANGVITIFDNHASKQDQADHSRGVVLQLNMEAMTASLVREYIHPTKILSVSQGNLQLLPNGHAFIGWGSAPVLSEFDAEGNLIFNERFPIGAQSYRAYRLPWAGRPADRPTIAVVPEQPDSVTVYASWNGATDIATWQILTGPNRDQLTLSHSAPKTGFETALTFETSARYIAARAVDAGGQILGTSPVTGVEAAG